MLSDVSSLNRLIGMPDTYCIAIVGASEKNVFTRRVVENLLAAGHGNVQLVNQRGGKIYGQEAYTSLKNLPHVPDLIILSTPEKTVVDLVREGADLGTRCFVIHTGTVPNGGTEAELRELGESRRLVIVGPNCLGIAHLHSTLRAYGAPIPPSARPGGVAVVSQSGSMSILLLNADRQFGYSMVASTGSEAALKLEDCVAAAVEDPNTKLIACIVEQLRRPDEFARAARLAADAEKPIVVLKLGQSERGTKVSASHTGALSGSAEAFRAYCTALGVIVVDNIDEMVEIIELLAVGGPKPTGRRVAVLGISGGELAYAADRLDHTLLTLADLSPKSVAMISETMHQDLLAVNCNPLDIGAGHSAGADFESSVRSVIETLAADNNVDCIIVVQDALPAFTPAQLQFFEGFTRGIASASTGSTPVIVVSVMSVGTHPKMRQTLAEAHVPVLMGDAGYAAVQRVVLQAQQPPSAVNVSALSISCAAKEGRPQVEIAARMLNEWESKELLRRSQLHIPAERLVHNEDELLRAIAQLRSPYVLKAVSASVPHKSAVGGVRLGITDSTDALAAYHSILRSIEEVAPGDLQGVIVASQYFGAFEAIVGARRDPDYGPIVMIGIGGVHAEAMNSVLSLCAPIRADEVLRRLSHEPWAAAMLDKRGPKVDMQSLADVASRLGDIICDDARITEVDLNPVLVHAAGEGTTILDSLVVGRFQ